MTLLPFMKNLQKRKNIQLPYLRFFLCFNLLMKLTSYSQIEILKNPRVAQHNF